MTDLQFNIQKRGSIKGTVTVITKWIDRLMKEMASEETQAVNREQIETRMDKLDEAWREFHETDNQIVLAGQPSQSEEFEDKYFEAKSNLKKILNIRSLSLAPPGPGANSSNRTSTDGFFDRTVTPGDVRLPRIQIEPFHGDYSKWRTFEDQFTDAFHNNESLSHVAKLHYLKGFLKGEVANLIRHLPLCEASYNEAWSKLKNRYDRKNYCLKELIQLFMNQPTVQLSNAKSLQSIYDTSDEVLRAIRAMGSKWESKDPWLIFILLSKLDLDTQEAWAQESKPNEKENPTIVEFLIFLDLRCRMFESCTVPKRLTPATPKHTAFKGNNNKAQLYTTSFAHNSCPLCSNDHLLFRCNQFRNLEITSRRDIVQRHQLCFNCLRPNHTGINCSSKARCYFCQQAHHTLLHVHNKGSVEHTTTSIPHKDDFHNKNKSSAAYCSTINTCSSQLPNTQATSNSNSAVKSDSIRKPSHIEPHILPSSSNRPIASPKSLKN